jgi:hypothetical protein
VIKAIGIDKQGKSSIVLLGLSEGNLELLKAKKPIVVDMTELGGTGKIILMYGQTEADIMADLQKADILVTPNMGETQN